MTTLLYLKSIAKTIDQFGQFAYKALARQQFDSSVGFRKVNDMYNVKVDLMKKVAFDRNFFCIEIHGKRLTLAKLPLFIFRNDASALHEIRYWAIWMVEAPWFENVIMLAILCNIALMMVPASYDPEQADSSEKEFFQVANGLCVALFTFECLLKVVARGLVCSPAPDPPYLRDPSNILDFTIVLTSLIEIFVIQNEQDSKLVLMRFFRCLRPLRTIQRMPTMRMMVVSLMDSIPRLARWLGTVGFICMVFALVGQSLFGTVYWNRCRLTPEPVFNISSGRTEWPIDPSQSRFCNGRYTCQNTPGGSPTYCGSLVSRADGVKDGISIKYAWDEIADNPQTDYGYTGFQSFSSAMFTVFQVATMEGWTALLYRYQDGRGNALPLIFFVGLVIFSGLVLLNLVLGVLWERFDKEMKNMAARSALEHPTPKFPLAIREMKLVDLVTEVTELERSEKEKAQRSTYDSGGGMGILRSICYSIVTQPSFDIFMLGVIAINCTALAIDAYPPLDETVSDIRERVNLFCTLFFTAEAGFKIFSLGFKFFEEYLNIADLVLVVAAFVELIAGGQGIVLALRVSRLLRVLKMMSASVHVKVLLRVTTRATVLTVNFFFFCMIVLVGLAVCGLHFFYIPEGTLKSQMQFTNFAWAFIVVFSLLTGEKWNSTMISIARSQSDELFPMTFLMCVYILTHLILLNLFLGMFVAAFATAREEVVNGYRLTLFNYRQGQTKKSEALLPLRTSMGVIIDTEPEDLPPAPPPSPKFPFDAWRSRPCGLVKTKAKDMSILRMMQVKQSAASRAERVVVLPSHLMHGRDKFAAAVVASKKVPTTPTTPQQSALQPSRTFGSSCSEAAKSNRTHRSTVSFGIDTEIEPQQDKAFGHDEAHNAIPPADFAAYCHTIESQPVTPRQSTHRSGLDNADNCGMRLRRNALTPLGKCRPQPLSFKEMYTQAKKIKASVVDCNIIAPPEKRTPDDSAGYCKLHDWVTSGQLETPRTSHHFRHAVLGNGQDLSKAKTPTTSAARIPKTPISQIFSAAPAPPEKIRERISTRNSVEGDSFGVSAADTTPRLVDNVGKWDMPDCIIRRKCPPYGDHNRDELPECGESRMVFSSAFESAPEVLDSSGDVRLIVVDESTISFQLDTEAPALPAARRQPVVEHNTALDVVEEGLYLSEKAIVAKATGLRQLCLWIVNSNFFEPAILALIMISSCALAIENPTMDSNSNVAQLLDITEKVIALAFAFEMMIKICAWGFYTEPSKTRDIPPGYFRSVWNWLDFTIVMTSVFDFIMDLISSEGTVLKLVKILRLLRTLRPLRIITRNKGLKIMVETLISATPTLVRGLIISVLFYVGFSILFMNLLKGELWHCSLDPTGMERPDIVTKADCLAKGGEWQNSDSNFDHIGYSFSSVLHMGSGEGWTDVMIKIINSVGIERQPRRDNRLAMAFVVLVFVAIGNFFLVNLLVGVLTDQYVVTRDNVHGIEMQTMAERRWYGTQRRMLSTSEYLKPLWQVSEPLKVQREYVYKVIGTKAFDTFIVGVICLNTILLCLWSPTEDKVVRDFKHVLSVTVVVIFDVELIAKLFVYFTSKYFEDYWNVFDFIVAFGSNAHVVARLFGKEGNALVSMLSAFRIVRVLRLVRSLPFLQTHCRTLLKLLPALLNVSLLLGIILFIYTCLGVGLFATVAHGDVIGPDQNFQTFGGSLLLVLRVCTGEDWHTLMYDTVTDRANCTTTVQTAKEIEREGPKGCGTLLGYPYFISFTSFVSIILMNLIIAVVLEGFEAVEQVESYEQYRQQVYVLAKVWSKKDTKATGYLPLADASAVLAEIPPPVGFQGLNAKRIGHQLRYLPIYDGRIHFRDAVVLACKRVYCWMNNLPEKEANYVKIDADIWGDWCSFYPEVPKPHNNLQTFLVGHVLVMEFLEEMVAQRKKERRRRIAEAILIEDLNDTAPLKKGPHSKLTNLTIARAANAAHGRNAAGLLMKTKQEKTAEANPPLSPSALTAHDFEAPMDPIANVPGGLRGTAADSSVVDPAQAMLNTAQAPITLQEVGLVGSGFDIPITINRSEW